MTEEGGRKSAALVGCLASGNWLSGSQHRGEQAAGNKREKTCEKFRQMKTHSVFFVRLPPSRLIVGHVGYGAVEGEKKGVNEVVKESQ